jgi:hypothetical protein
VIHESDFDAEALQTPRSENLNPAIDGPVATLKEQEEVVQHILSKEYMIPITTSKDHIK